ncbi:MAG: enoyl-CoA hydratase [Frankiales bacterium]|nr:enoyl-CoA hydratase [Frankiales bacterium]
MTEAEATPVEEAPLLVRADGGVLRVQLNRPRARNAINWPLRRELLRVLTEAAEDPAVRLLVLSGDDRAFCAGGDVKEMGNGPEDTSAKLVMAANILRAITTMPKAVVAEVRGFASGAGFGLALACDVVLADSTAVFQAPFVQRGLVPDLGTAWTLARQVGRHKAMEIVLSGRDVLADEAVALGLVAHAWPSSSFRQQADAYERALASCPVTAVGLSKRMVDGALVWDRETGMEVERMSQLLATTSAEHVAFLESVRAGVPLRGGQT